MSDSATPVTPVSPGNVPAQLPPPKKGGSTRLLILIGLMLLLALALYYDRKSARPGAEAGHAKLQNLRQEQIAKPGHDVATPEDIAQLLGKQASRREETDWYTIETFCWRRGFPLLTYDVYAVYQKTSDDKVRFYAATLFQRPETNDLPHEPVKPRYLTEEEHAAIKPPPPGPPGGTPPPVQPGPGVTPPEPPAAKDAPAKEES